MEIGSQEKGNNLGKTFTGMKFPMGFFVCGNEDGVVLYGKLDEDGKVEEIYQWEFEMNWISVNKKLPVICHTIMFTDGKEVFCGWLETYLDNEDQLYYDSVGRGWPENVTHWMNLPKPPEKE